jgi:hypothetical protein
VSSGWIIKGPHALWCECHASLSPCARERALHIVRDNTLILVALWGTPPAHTFLPAVHAGWCRKIKKKVFSRWIKARDKVLAAAGIKKYYTCREQASFHLHLYYAGRTKRLCLCFIFGKFYDAVRKWAVNTCGQLMKLALCYEILSQQIWAMKIIEQLIELTDWVVREDIEKCSQLADSIRLTAALM